jgi:hypothetical protein
LFTNTAQAMNEQAADVAGRITDSEYHEDGTVIVTDTTSDEEEVESTPSVTPRSDIFVSSIVLENATQRSFWDDTEALSGHNGSDSALSPAEMENVKDLVQACLPGM